MRQISYQTGFAGKVSEIDVSNPQDTSKSFHFGYNYAREKYADWDHQQIVPPFPPHELPLAIRNPLSRSTSARRAGLHIRCDNQAAAEYAVEIPAPVRESTAIVDYGCSYSVSVPF